MKNLIALTVVLLFPVVLCAAEVRGAIVSVDLVRHELVLDKVTPRQAANRYILDDKTPVLYGKEPGSLTDIPTGRRARVEIEERGGQLVVKAIHVNGKAPAAAKPAAEGSKALATRPVAEGATVTGTLRRVGVTDREVVIIGPGAKGPETETTIAVPESARVTRDGKEASFGELKEGERVAVTVEKRDGRLSAQAIQSGTISAPAAATGPAAAAKEPSNVVPKLRLLLRVADGILQQMDKK